MRSAATKILVDDHVTSVRGQGPAIRDRRGGGDYSERVRITKNGHESVVLVAAEDLEAIEATLELLTDQGRPKGASGSRGRDRCR